LANVTSAIRDTVPISVFNRGQAGQIFESVRKTGAKVVMKNNSAECVLLSPEEYIKLIDEVNDARLLALAQKRMENFELSDTLSESEVLKKSGIDPEVLDRMDDVEIE